VWDGEPAAVVEAAAAVSALPQSLQKRLPGALTAAQPGHGTARPLPHELQNLALSGLSCPHVGQVIAR
jgi:hypothetical protein